MNNRLDQTDIKILNILQKDARLEIRQIAERVHKSASPVHERIRKLQKEGYIKGYVAVIDREKIGRSLVAIAQVSLKEHNKEALLQFQTQVNDLEEVHLCLQLSGVCDFQLHIAVSHAGNYYDFLVNRLCSLPNVGHVETSFVLRETKVQSPVLL